jgi:hypothetical protein
VPQVRGCRVRTGQNYVAKVGAYAEQRLNLRLQTGTGGDPAAAIEREQMEDC